jgi:hypothetical protein
MLSSINPFSRYNYHDFFHKRTNKKDVKNIHFIESPIQLDVIKTIENAKKEHTIKNKSLNALIKLTKDNGPLTPGDVISTLDKYGDTGLGLEIAKLIIKDQQQTVDKQYKENESLSDKVSELSNENFKLYAVAERPNDVRNVDIFCKKFELSTIEGDKLVSEENIEMKKKDATIRELVKEYDNLEVKHGFALGIISNLREELNELKDNEKK